MTTEPDTPGRSSAPGATGPRTARDRARAEITAEILESARRQLVAEGAAALSLRQVARDLGMASSAVYRYVASRDELLTRLIVSAYDSLGAAVESRESTAPRSDLLARFHAIAVGVRDWALTHPHEYALIYGTPVPGYRAPQDTVGPASRVPTLLIALLVESGASGSPATIATPPAQVGSALAPLRPAVPSEVPDDMLLRGLLCWSSLFGAVSFELFGHLHNVVSDDPDERSAYFAHQVDLLAAMVGLT